MASQSGKIVADRTSLVGSIGTFAVLYDLSKAFETAGVKVHLVRAGSLKGAGTPGTEIDAEVLAEMQRIVSGLNEHFLAAVASGRRLSLDHVRKLADGRVHLAADAQRLGLIDAVGSLGDVLAKLQGPIETPATRWDAAIASKLATGLDRRSAMSAVVRESPELHRQYIEFANQQN